MLGQVFSALADLKDKLGQQDQAISFEKTALRYNYISGTPESTATSHYNLANYLSKCESRYSLDHVLVACAISSVTDSDLFPSSLSGLAWVLFQFGNQFLPDSFDQVCYRVEQVDGVRLRELWQRLAMSEEFADMLLKDLVEIAKKIKLCEIRL
jgi:hypothetical protein